MLLLALTGPIGPGQAGGGASSNSHDFVGLNSLLFVLVVGVCLFLARVIREYKIYYLPASAASMIFGMAIGIVSIFFGHGHQRLPLIR